MQQAIMSRPHPIAASLVAAWCLLSGPAYAQDVQDRPKLDVIYVPMGDTALIRGVASAAKQCRASIHIVGVVAEQAPAYRVGFSHANHDASEKLACGACHQVRAGLPRARQVSAPSPLNHHATARAFSCASCHNGQRTFGGDDFSVCTRCHKGSEWRF